MTVMQPQIITLYGIPNCDTVKRARAWLASQGLHHQFHDFKKQGVPERQLDAWIRSLGWEVLLNTRGTMWRRLDDSTREAVTDAASARAVMQAQPSVIKRPVMQWANGEFSVGFNEAAWRARID